MASLTAFKFKTYGAIPLQNLKNGRQESQNTLKMVYLRMDRASNFLERRRAEAQVFMDALSLILAFLVFLPLGKITSEFEGNCLLYSNIFLNMNEKKVVSIDLTKTKYHNESQCNFTTYLNAVVAIHCFVWIWFFFHLESVKRKNGSILNLLLPALVCRLTFFVFVLISSMKISTGTTTWCDNIGKNIEGIPGFAGYSCGELQDLSWERSRSKFYTFSIIAMICSWLLVVSILVTCALTVLHLYNDFLRTMGPELDAIKDKESKKEGYTPIDGNNQTDGFDNAGADRSDSPVDPNQVEVNADIHNLHKDKEFELANEDSEVRNRSKRDH